MCEVLIYLLNNIFIELILLLCYKRDFMASLIIKKLKLYKHLTYHSLDIDNPYFEGMVGQIYPPELLLNKANAPDTKAPFFICISPFHLFHQKFMIIAMNLILTWSFFLFFVWCCHRSTFYGAYNSD